MAHEAIINFLFNSEGAMREIDNFKSRFSKALDGLAESASGIGKILGVGGGLTAGFAVKSMMDHIKLINDLKIAYSEMPIEEIGRFSNALRLMGAAPEEATDALHSMQEVINKAVLEGGNLPKLMTHLGLRVKDANGKTKTAVQLFKELDAAIRKSNLTEEGINEVLKETGLSGGAFTAMKRLVTQSDRERAEFEKKLNKFWVPSAEDAKRIQKFSDSINTLKLRFDELGKVLLDLGFQSIIDGINKGIDQFNNASPETQKSIIYIIAALSLLKPALKTLKSLHGLLQLSGAVFSPWLILGAVFLAVANNIGGCKDKLDEWLSEYNEWVKQLKEDHPFLAEFAQQLADLGQAILHPIDTLTKHWEAMTKAWRELKEELPLDLFSDKTPAEKGFNFVNKALDWMGAETVKTNIPTGSIDNSVQITNYITADMSGDVDRDKFRAFTDRIAEGVERGTRNGLKNMSIQFGGQTVGGR